MNYKVFYRKYRPKNFSELIGQNNIKEILINSIKSQRIAHAYIFTGPRGTGKTSTAKIFAKTLNCIENSNGISCDKCINCTTFDESADIIEIDAASNNGVEEIRALRDSVKIAPYNSKYKIYIIDEVHMLSNSAWNAFLKTLEEPPSHVIFILATTEINKIPETVKSRCQRFDFSKINNNVMHEYLKEICIRENIEIEMDALNEIIKLSSGCLRDALSYLDQISKFETKVTTDLIESNFGVITNNKLALLMDAITNCDKNKINNIIDSINNSGITPLNFINNFIDYLLNVILHENVNIMEIKKLIMDLNNIILRFNSSINPYILIKVELISHNYFPGNNYENISREIKTSEIEKQKVIKNDLLSSANKSEYIENDNKLNQFKISNDIKKIRVNNSFCEASKLLKKEFIELWKQYIKKLEIDNDYNILGFVENSIVQVVSSTNILISMETEAETILFNNNLDIIETNFNLINKTKYKFICLTNYEWKEQMNLFIKSDKKFIYIDEQKKQENVKTKEIAENIFGNDIIEVR